MAVGATGSAEESEEDRAYGGHVRNEGARCRGVADVDTEEPEEDRAYGGHVDVGASCEVRMEGSDAKTLIAKRMGITQGEVESKLVTLNQKGELDGTADRSSGPSDSSNISLTAKDLEDFELAEAEARNRAPSQTGTPYKLAFKPAVLGNPGASPQTATATATTATPARPAPAAEGQDNKVEMVNTQPQSGASTSKWSDKMEAEEAPPPPPESSEEVASDVWPERKRYEEKVEAEHIYGAISSIDVPLLDLEGLGWEQLQSVVQELVVQVNVAHKALATAGYVVVERSRESLQQSKVSSDMATEALLKSYEVSAVAASSSRQSWKMCVILTGPDMPVRSKEAERKPDTTGRYLSQTLFGVTLRRPEEVAISHFRGTLQTSSS
jgi:hypothetical protein